MDVMFMDGCFVPFLYYWLEKKANVIMEWVFTVFSSGYHSGWGNTIQICEIEGHSNATLTVSFHVLLSLL